MRCLACNKILTPKESTRKYASAGTFLDLCDGCLEPVSDEIPVIEGNDEVPDFLDSDDLDFDGGDEGGESNLY